MKNSNSHSINTANKNMLLIRDGHLHYKEQHIRFYNLCSKDLLKFLFKIMVKHFFSGSAQMEVISLFQINPL